MSPPKGQKGIGRQATPSGLRSGAELNVMTVRDLAEYLHCHYGTVYRLIRQRDIPGFVLGGSWRFLKSEVDKWIAQGGGRPPSNASVVKTEGGRRGRKQLTR